MSRLFITFTELKLSDGWWEVDKDITIANRGKIGPYELWRTFKAREPAEVAMAEPGIIRRTYLLKAGTELAGGPGVLQFKSMSNEQELSVDEGKQLWD